MLESIKSRSQLYQDQQLSCPSTSRHLKQLELEQLLSLLQTGTAEPDD